MSVRHGDAPLCVPPPAFIEQLDTQLIDSILHLINGDVTNDETIPQQLSASSITKALAIAFCLRYDNDSRTQSRAFNISKAINCFKMIVKRAEYNPEKQRDGRIEYNDLYAISCMLLEDTKEYNDFVEYYIEIFPELVNDQDAIVRILSWMFCVIYKRQKATIGRYVSIKNARAITRGLQTLGRVGFNNLSLYYDIVLSCIRCNNAIYNIKYSIERFIEAGINAYIKMTDRQVALIKYSFYDCSDESRYRYIYYLIDQTHYLLNRAPIDRDEDRCLIDEYYEMLMFTYCDEDSGEYFECTDEFWIGLVYDALLTGDTELLDSFYEGFISHIKAELSQESRILLLDKQESRILLLDKQESRILLLDKQDATHNIEDLVQLFDTYNNNTQGNESLNAFCLEKILHIRLNIKVSHETMYLFYALDEKHVKNYGEWEDFGIRRYNASIVKLNKIFNDKCDIIDAELEKAVGEYNDTKLSSGDNDDGTVIATIMHKKIINNNFGRLIETIADYC